MKLLKSNILIKSLVLSGLVSISLSSCQEEEGNLIEYTPGNHLAISGASSAKVGDAGMSYYLNMNDKGGDYGWSIETGATITENSENDAYVSVDFNEPGTYNLAVANGDASGSKTVEVTSRAVNFEADTVLWNETTANDTLAIPLLIGGGFNGNFTVSYTLGGTMDAAGYDVVAGYESPYTVAAGDAAEIKVVVYSDETSDAEEDIALTIDDIAPVLADEYIASDTLQTTVYTFSDDWKVASINSDSVWLSSAGVYSYPVSLSNASGSDITVSYTISAGTGFSDATATDVAGTLVFEAGVTENDITLSVSDVAFAADQDVTITLTGLVGGGGEASIDGDNDSKVIVIDVE